MIKTDELKETYQKTIDTLKTERDEIRVKIHLASLEAQEEWKLVEEKWRHLKTTGGQIENAAKESASELGQAISLLGEELKESYKRFKKVL